MFNPHVMQAVAQEQVQDRLREAEHCRMVQQLQQNKPEWFQQVGTLVKTITRRGRAKSHTAIPALSKG